MGTHPVLQSTNAAALAVATPAVETLREVCWLFGEEILKFLSQFGREPSEAFLSFSSWEESEFSSFLSSWPLNPKHPLLRGPRALKN